MTLLNLDPDQLLSTTRAVRKRLDFSRPVPDQLIGECVAMVAPFSGDTHGFANITTVTIGPATEKVTVALPANCSGISFQRQDAASSWATIAYNLGA
jgi:hypothetical protein